ncbi:uncharacterized protein LOC142336676 [Convolutriloba macropyga]|uniref:uncharacterized protein LOC142336676 n=1 Tax=Convolutriloba macropyga TaxID=536237 RepID=UPI003F5239DE
MSPVAIILKEEANPDLRTIAYGTYKKEKVVVVKQELRDNEWITINHMALPIFVADSKKPRKPRQYKLVKFSSTRLNANSLNSQGSGSFHNCQQQSRDDISYRGQCGSPFDASLVCRQKGFELIFEIGKCFTVFYVNTVERLASYCDYLSSSGYYLDTVEEFKLVTDILTPRWQPPFIYDLLLPFKMVSEENDGVFVSPDHRKVLRRDDPLWGDSDFYHAKVANATRDDPKLNKVCTAVEFTLNRKSHALTKCNDQDNRIRHGMCNLKFL